MSKCKFKNVFQNLVTDLFQSFSILGGLPEMTVVEYLNDLLLNSL